MSSGPGSGTTIADYLHAIANVIQEALDKGDDFEALALLFATQQMLDDYLKSCSTTATHTSN